METARMCIYVHAPAERVWSVLTDYAGYARIPQVTLARVLAQGSPEPAGVGALREVRVLGTTFVEEITRFEAPRALGYRIVRSSGPPLEHRGGEVELIPRGEGTEVRWTTTFRVALPVVGGAASKALRLVMQHTFNEVLMWLKDDLERAHAEQAPAHAAAASA